MDTDTVITLPKGVLESARMSAEGRLSVGRARKLARMSSWTFCQLLGRRSVSPHYDVTDLEENLATLRALERL